MKSPALTEIEDRFGALSLEEQLWPLERLVRRMRDSAGTKQTTWERDLAEMAADPQIQAELRKIDAAFRCTERDGLAAAR